MCGLAELIRLIIGKRPSDESGEHPSEKTARVAGAVLNCTELKVAVKSCALFVQILRHSTLPHCHL